MKKNPFKKQGIVDTIINVGIGGAANVAMDSVVANVDALAGLGNNVINAIKIGVGVLGGTMTTNKMIRAAVDGIAVVGASNLVNDLINGDAGGNNGGSSSDESTKGLPFGTISGRYRLGNKNYKRSVNATPSAFMSK